MLKEFGVRGFSQSSYLKWRTMHAGSNQAIFHGATEETRRKAAEGIYRYLENLLKILL